MNKEKIINIALKLFGAYGAISLILSLIAIAETLANKETFWDGMFGLGVIIAVMIWIEEEERRRGDYDK